VAFGLVEACEDFGAVGGYIDSFLDHGCSGSVLGRKSPAIRILDQMPVTHSHHGLDSNRLVDCRQNKEYMAPCGASFLFRAR